MVKIFFCPIWMFSSIALTLASVFAIQIERVTIKYFIIDQQHELDDLENPSSDISYHYIANT